MKIQTCALIIIWFWLRRCHVGQGVTRTRKCLPQVIWGPLFTSYHGAAAAGPRLLHVVSPIKSATRLEAKRGLLLRLFLFLFSLLSPPLRSIPKQCLHYAKEPPGIFLAGESQVAAVFQSSNVFFTLFALVSMNGSKKHGCLVLLAQPLSRA